MLLDSPNPAIATISKPIAKRWVETEVYGIPVESRTLPAGCMDGHSPRIIRSQKILYKISYKDFNRR
jgi:hypothetical protein